MSSRLRLALLVLFLTTTACFRVGSALAAHARAGLAVQEARERAGVVRFARRLLGVRYTYGGTSPRSGFDCSGFTRFVYAHFGIALPHSSFAQFDLGRRVARGSLQPGDLVFFDGLGHVGLYLGRGLFIHAPHGGTRVSIDPLGGWYAAEYDGARRLI